MMNPVYVVDHINLGDHEFFKRFLETGNGGCGSVSSSGVSSSPGTGGKSSSSSGYSDPYTILAAELLDTFPQGKYSELPGFDAFTFSHPLIAASIIKEESGYSDSCDTLIIKDEIPVTIDSNSIVAHNDGITRHDMKEGSLAVMSKDKAISDISHSCDVALSHYEKFIEPTPFEARLNYVPRNDSINHFSLRSRYETFSLAENDNGVVKSIKEAIYCAEMVRSKILGPSSYDCSFLYGAVDDKDLISVVSFGDKMLTDIGEYYTDATEHEALNSDCLNIIELFNLKESSMSVNLISALRERRSGSRNTNYYSESTNIVTFNDALISSDIDLINYYSRKPVFLFHDTAMLNDPGRMTDVYLYNLISRPFTLDKDYYLSSDLCDQFNNSPLYNDSDFKLELVRRVVSEFINRSTSSLVDLDLDTILQFCNLGIGHYNKSSIRRSNYLQVNGMDFTYNYTTSCVDGRFGTVLSTWEVKYKEKCYKDLFNRKGNYIMASHYCSPSTPIFVSFGNHNYSSLYQPKILQKITYVKTVFDSNGLSNVLDPYYVIDTYSNFNDSSVFRYNYHTMKLERVKDAEVSNDYLSLSLKNWIVLEYTDSSVGFNYQFTLPLDVPLVNLKFVIDAQSLVKALVVLGLKQCNIYKVSHDITDHLKKFFHSHHNKIIKRATNTSNISKKMFIFDGRKLPGPKDFMIANGSGTRGFLFPRDTMD